MAMYEQVPHLPSKRKQIGNKLTLVALYERSGAYVPETLRGAPLDGR